MDKAVEVCYNTFLEGVFNTANFTREEALLTVRWQFTMAKNVQKIKNASKESWKTKPKTVKATFVQVCVPVLLSELKRKLNYTK